MRLSRPPASIKLQNSNNSTQYCATPALPPWVTEKPWWERVRDRQSNSQPNPATNNQATNSQSTQPCKVSPPATVEDPKNYGNSGDSGNCGNSGTEKPWWERVRDRQSNSQPNPATNNQATNSQSTQPCKVSPPATVEDPKNYGNSGDSGNCGNSNGWTWTLVQINNDGDLQRHLLRRSPEGKLLVQEELIGKPYTITAENVPAVLPADDPDNHFPPATGVQAITAVQIGPKSYVSVYTLPNGEPELPATHASVYHARQKRDGSWCFLPNRFSSVPEPWEMYSYPQSPQPIPQPSETPAANHPHPAEKTNARKETPKTKHTSSSDHQITGSPDHPIPRDHPILKDPANPLQPA